MKSENSKVFVLYGALRSGTTLLRLILDMHEEIACLGESDFILDHLVFEEIDIRIDPHALNDDRIFQSSELSVPNTTSGVDAFWQLVEQQHLNKKILVLVVHRHLDRLLRVFPEVKVIHLVRDPRDVARSSIGMGWAGNTYFGVDHWLETERDWELYSHIFKTDQFHQIRFEDLVKSPDSELEKICQFIGVGYDPIMKSFYQNSTYSQLDSSLAFQWKRKLSIRELSDIEGKVGSLLSRRGYDSGIEHIMTMTKLRYFILSMQNKSYKLKFRINRFGLIDAFLFTVSNRFRMKRLHRRVKLRMGEKQKKYLK